MPGVTVRRGSAFAVAPEPVDWLCCDVAAYPDRLLALLRRWTESGQAGRIVCTIKFQGATDHAASEALAAIPGARLVHLFHNKHELTFVWTKPRG
jgi:23S rRNA (cytidine2498-2'-O)-methyltransferase